MLSDYKKRSTQKNKAGNPLPSQAHMELIIKENLTVDLGDTIYYVNTGTKKSHGDVQRINHLKPSKKELILFHAGEGEEPLPFIPTKN